MPRPFSASTISGEAPAALKLWEVKKAALLAGAWRCCRPPPLPLPLPLPLPPPLPLPRTPAASPPLSP